MQIKVIIAVFLLSASVFVNSQIISSDPTHPCYFNPCGIYGSCSVVNGSAHCTCEPGYVYDGTVCERPHPCKPSPCHEQATCRVHKGQVQCFCIYGFTGSGRECTPLDPCRDSSCHVNANCIPAADNATYTCVCADGFIGDGTDACVPIILPTTTPPPPPPPPTTTTTTTRKTTTTKTPVVVIDPCQNNRCHKNAVCIPVFEDASYFCRCSEGFIGNGDTCLPMDPCQNNRCHENANCIANVPRRGMYRCKCQEGYTGNGHDCKSKNPCDNNRCHQNADCIPVFHDKSFYCRCKSGYVGNGQTCRKEDPCQNSCHKEANCVFDSFINVHTCHCRPPYVGDGFRCQLFNPCDVVRCHHYATCTVVGEEAKCGCRNDLNYYGNGRVCTHINNLSQFGSCSHCHVNAHCNTNWHAFNQNFNLFNRFFQTTGPGYIQNTCQCKPGYFGNGYNCYRAV